MAMRRSALQIAAAALAGAPFAVRVLVRALSPRPGNLGITDGRLAPCPDSPNCVSSRADDPPHAIAPYRFTDSPAEAFERLRNVVAAQRGAKLISAGDNYLHFEFTSRLCGYLDDVEFQLDPERREIHFRSASRLGYGDLGVNRRRMESIRRALEPAQ
jgi:uncharacterized protein (DUF1499 family)